MNKVRIGHAVLLYMCLFPFLLSAEDPPLARLFAEKGLTGTLIIESLDGATRFLHNLPRARTPLIPASTFKIPNTLIALDEGAIENGDQIIKWDKTVRFRPEWNQDQTLRSAFSVSCVWFYQELARRIGNENYLRHLKAMNYGNGKAGPRLDSFWLDGDLRISAMEKVSFLRRLVKNDLPYTQQHIDLLKNIMIVGDKEQYILRAKTGWAVRKAVQHGWYVGWLEKKDGQIWLFALNFDGEFQKDAKQRQELVLAGFRAMGILTG